MKALFLTALTAALTLINSPAQGASSPAYQALPAQNLELRQARWFDGQGWRQGTLFVQGGVFSAHRPARVDRVMHLQGRFLSPPLAEAHNHNLQFLRGFQQNGPRYLHEGVFYAAMLAGDPEGVAPLRALAGRPDSPDVLFASAVITSSYGHPIGMALADQPPPPEPPVRYEDVADKSVLVADSPEEVERKWPLVLRSQTDWVKLILSYHERPDLIANPKLKGYLGMRADTAAAVVRLAHASGLRVSAHVDSIADFGAALQAGVDQIAHLPGYYPHHGNRIEDYLISPELAAEAASRGVEVITTTAVSHLFQPKPELLARIQNVQKINLRLLRQAGVKLLVGSDNFAATGLAEYRNLASLQVFDAAELLKLATVDTPRALFPKRRLGCFEPGCEASFLVLKTDPLRDKEAFGQVQLRVKQGHVLQALPAKN